MGQLLSWLAAVYPGPSKFLNPYCWLKEMTDTYIINSYSKSKNVSIQAPIMQGLLGNSMDTAELITELHFFIDPRILQVQKIYRSKNKTKLSVDS